MWQVLLSKPCTVWVLCGYWLERGSLEHCQTCMGGRKHCFFHSLDAASLGLAVAAINYYIFLLFRVATGVFNSGQGITSFSLLMEVIGTSKRSSVGMAFQASFPVGFVVLALLGYIFRGWRTLVIVSTLLGTGLLATWRWLTHCVALVYVNFSVSSFQSDSWVTKMAAGARQRGCSSRCAEHDS